LVEGEVWGRTSSEPTGELRYDQHVAGLEGLALIIVEELTAAIRPIMAKGINALCVGSHTDIAASLTHSVLASATASSSIPARQRCC
jgi:hypothetical protein